MKANLIETLHDRPSFVGIGPIIQPFPSAVVAWSVLVLLQPCLSSITY